MPGFEQMMDSFAFDQRSGKNCAKNRRTRARFEALHIDSARQIKEFLLRETLHAEGVGRFFREDDEQIGQLVFFQETFALQEEIFLPTAS